MEANQPFTVIEPRAGFPRVPWGELWLHRRVLYFLTWRTIKVRYRQSVLRAAWAVLQPLGMMLVFTFFFGVLAHVPSPVSYPVFIYAALVPWVFFTRAFSEMTNSVVADQHILSKVFFPRLYLPVSRLIDAFLDFLIALALLGLLMAAYGIRPTASIVYLPLVVLLLVGLSLGVGLWAAALNVSYRDMQHSIPFLTQALFFLSPIVYPRSLVPDRFQLLYSLNPVSGVIEAFRAAVFGPAAATFSSVDGILATGVTVALIGSGLVFFLSRERGFADVLGG